MFKVHHRLSDMQFRQVANERIGVDGTAGILTTAGDAFAQQIAFANQRQISLAVDKSVLGGADHQETTIAAGFLQAQYMFWRNFDARQHLAQRLAAAFAFNGENHRAAEGFKEATQIVQRRFILRLNRQLGQGLIAEISMSGFLRQTLGF